MQIFLKAYAHINKVVYEGGNLQRFHNCLLSEASYYCFSSHNGCYARILDLHQQHIPSYVICDEVGITDFYIFGNQVSRHPKIQYSSFQLLDQQVSSAFLKKKNVKF